MREVDSLLKAFSEPNPIIDFLLTGRRGPLGKVGISRRGLEERINKAVLLEVLVKRAFQRG